VIRSLRQAHNQALAAYDVDGVVHLAAEDFVMILGGGGQLIQVGPPIAISWPPPLPIRIICSSCVAPTGSTSAFPMPTRSLPKRAVGLARARMETSHGLLAVTWCIGAGAQGSGGSYRKPMYRLNRPR